MDWVVVVVVIITLVQGWNSTVLFHHSRICRLLHRFFFSGYTAGVGCIASGAASGLVGDWAGFSDGEVTASSTNNVCARMFRPERVTLGGGECGGVVSVAIAFTYLYDSWVKGGGVRG